jgi:hypothetical protein
MKTRNEGNAVDEMNEGSIKGAIRIPLRSSPFLFNDVALRRVPCKSIESLLLLFSTPTAPTNVSYNLRLTHLPLHTAGFHLPDQRDDSE